LTFDKPTIWFSRKKANKRVDNSNKPNNQRQTTTATIMTKQQRYG